MSSEQRREADQERLKFADEFPAVTLKQWEAAAQQSLKGRDVSTLSSFDLDGIESRVLYGPDQSQGPSGSTRPAVVGELVRRHPIHNHSGIAAALRADVAAIVVAPSIASSASLSDSPSIFLQTGLATAAEIRAHVGRVGVELPDVQGGLGLDPLGGHYQEPSVDLNELPQLVSEAMRVAPNLLSVSVSSATVHLAGASDAQELGSVLAASVAYLKALELDEISPAAAARQMEWSLQLDPDFFASIIKLRAARALITQLFGACGVANVDAMKLHATTAERSLSVFDTSVNLLRSTSAVAAAQVGGASSVTVLAADLRGGANDETSARMALNIPKVLNEEAHLGQVSDPAGGSWYLEHQTDALARKAWEFFCSIEARGGLVSVQSDGWLDDAIAHTADVRRELIAQRSVVLTGVNEFAMLGENDLAAHQVDVTGGDLGMKAHYLDEDFVSLRLAAACHEGSLDVAVICVGKESEYTARLSWVKNLLAAGGLVVRAMSAESVGPGEVVILCGTDAAYAEDGSDVVAVLSESGVSQVLVAGTSTSAGDMQVSGWVGSGLNAVEFLRQLQIDLGVTQ